MDLRHALQLGRAQRRAPPTHTIVILIMQSQANGSMVAAMMLSKRAKWQEAFRARYQKEVISGGLYCLLVLWGMKYVTSATQLCQKWHKTTPRNACENPVWPSYRCKCKKVRGPNIFTRLCRGCTLGPVGNSVLMKSLFRVILIISQKGILHTLFKFVKNQGWQSKWFTVFCIVILTKTMTFPLTQPTNKKGQLFHNLNHLFNIVVVTMIITWFWWSYTFLTSKTYRMVKVNDLLNLPMWEWHVRFS